MKRKVLLLFALILMGFSANAQFTSIALVGEAAGGWPGDPGNPGPTDIHQMTSVDGINWTLVDVPLTNAAVGGGVKFRAENSWTTNWGSADFPNGTGTQGGANIPCIGGTYTVTFNSQTGVYSFGGGAPIAVVNLIGAATGGTPISMTTTDAETYTATNVTLVTGGAQFEVDGAASGGTDFPAGIGIDPGQQIPVVGGDYTLVSFNINSGEYIFTAAPLVPPVSIVGSAVGGWPGDIGNPGPTDINQMTSTNGENYSFSKLAVTVGALKFRQDNAWTTSWGGLTFPAGPEAGNTQDIAVAAGQEGTYDVVFTRSTGAYAFALPTIAVVGSGVGGWPGEVGNPGPTDLHQMTTTDGVTYTVLGVTVTDGEAKFRQGNAWDVNWGTAAFPSGVGTQGGANIPTMAGTYDITLNRVTGDFSFAPLATTNFNKSNFKVYPNPSQNNWNFTSAKGAINSIQIVDVLGKNIMTISPKDINATVDASSLNAGIYFAKVSTATATETVKLVKN